MVISDNFPVVNQRNPFKMVYGSDMMNLEDINTSKWNCEHFNEEDNPTELRTSVDQIEEVREITQIQNFTTKKWEIIRYNTKKKPIAMKDSDMLLK